MDVYGFQYLSGSITAGTAADDTDGHLVSAVQGSFDSDGRFTGTMPNQPVEITYLYEATEEGYEYKIHYLDNGTQDERLRNITGPDAQNVTADTPVTAEFKICMVMCSRLNARSLHPREPLTAAIILLELCQMTVWLSPIVMTETHQSGRI